MKKKTIDSKVVVIVGPTGSSRGRLFLINNNYRIGGTMVVQFFTNMILLLYKCCVSYHCVIINNASDTLHRKFAGKTVVLTLCSGNTIRSFGYFGVNPITILHDFTT